MPRALLATLLALVTVGSVTLLTARPAAAEPDRAEGALTALPRETVDGFRLLIDRASMYDANGAAIRGVEKSGAVSKVTPAAVAGSRQHAGRALCHTTGMNGTFKYNGFCWDSGDDTTSAYSEGGGWHPQGLTAAHDAEPGGTVGGRHLYVASWFYGDKATGKDQFGRISLVDSTGDAWSYGHVMLVKPTGDEANANFEAVTNVHADGIVWYKNKLFVANGGELQVYDFQYMWKMGTTAEKRVGIVNGVASARHHQWALPMVGRYVIGSTAHNPRYCPAPPQKGWACLGSLSLDRSGAVDHLVSGEYYTADKGPVARVMRWPLNETVQLPLADNGDTIGSSTATGAFDVPVRQLQGVATDGAYYYLSAQCPNGYMGDDDPTDYGSYSCVYEARPGEVPTVLTRAPSLTQNLSYSHASGRLWGMNELTGKRVVFSLLPRLADSAVPLSNDYSHLCAGVGSSYEDSARVIQWGCNKAKDQRWVFEDTTDSNGNRAYFLRNIHSGKCMGVQSSLANGTGVIQYTCNGAVDEKWWYDAGTRELRNVYSGKCLALGAGATKGTQLIQYTCNGAADEKWSKIDR
ncbi:RICIN domain-containing protein [Streptomyces sp. NPDC004779]